MATSLSGRFRFLAQLTHTGDTDLSTLSETIDGTALPSWVVANGTGANQADLIWHDQRTLSSGANEELDLAGSLVDAFGTTLTFARIKAIVIYAASDNGALIQVGGAASNGFINWVADSTDIINVRAGGTFALIAPDATAYAVTAGTGDLLKITNSDGAAAATYDIYLIGASA
jgi:hypothetical protein